MNLYRCLLILCCSLIIKMGSAQSYTEQGAPFMHTWIPKDYRGNAQIWSCAQDKRGVMYFGDNKQIIEFDGKTWTIIPTENNTAVRSLEVDSLGRIYVGGVNEFGYLEPTQAGKLQYKSLSQRLPEKERKFLEIHKIFITSGGVYFISLKTIFKFSHDKITRTSVNLKSFGGFEANGKIYLTHRTKGICLLNDTTLIQLKNLDNYSTGISFPGNKLLLSDTAGGWCLYDMATSECGKFTTPATDYFKIHQVYILTRIDTDKFAVATKTGGIVILSNKGDVVQVINQERGLFAGQVYSMYLDNTKNLWAGMSKGIAKTDINFPVLKFDYHQNVNEYVLTTLRHNNRRYLGNLEGVFYLPDYKINPTEDNHKFRKINNYNGSCWDLQEYNNLLFGVGNSGIWVFKDTIARMITEPRSNFGAYCIGISKKFPDVLFIGMNGRLEYFRLNNSSEYKNIKVLENFVFPEIKEKIKKITCDKDGNIWLTTGYEGIYFIDFPNGNINDYRVTLLGKRNGLESLLEPQAFNINDEIMIGSETGIFKPEFPKVNGNPDSLIQLKKKPLFGKTIDNSIGQVLKIEENKYLLKGASIYIATTDGNKYKYDSCGFKRLKDSYQIYLASVGSDRNISFCTDVAYLYYNTSVSRDFKKKFNLIIRKVTVGKDSTLFGGTFYNETDSFKTIATSQPSTFKPTLDYKYNSVTFLFSGLFYEEPEATVFRYKLDGFDKEWSPWSKEGKAVFTNLPEGHYDLKVKALNVYGAEGNPCEFKFVVLPPWYREWWAFTIYVILFIVFTSLVTYTYTRRLIRQKNFLEKLITELKIEMMERKQAEIQLIAMKEKAEESNRLKTAFLAMMNHELRTPLNHILGFSELIMSGVAPEENASFAATIQLSGKSLLSYVEDVFDLALVEQENIKLRYQTFSLMELFIENKVSLDSLLSASEKNDQIRLIFKPDTQWLSTMVTTDKNKINKVLNNLFKNAVKFTHVGTIEFGYKMESSSNLTFYIKDTGIGIPKEKQGIIFDFFRQGDDTTTKAYGGIGIGLAISKKIANILKGELHVVSEPGMGSTFLLTVPVEVGGYQNDNL